MSAYEKLYTVEDIARMTSLTTRTIRNYLKEGLLTGRKVGGQWRFTRENIEGLFESSSAKADAQNVQCQDVTDFIDGVNTDVDGDIQICTIADYYCHDIAHAKKLGDRMSGLFTESADIQRQRFLYDYIEKETKARYTFFGTPHTISLALSVLEEERKRLNKSLGTFNGRAKDYADYRPSYPLQLIDFILSKVGGPQPITIADMGSGTGKMSDCLLRAGSTVFAVEPNEDMRRQAESLFSGNPAFHSIAGTAENTTLAADSVDAIICAESFHWFDNEQSKQEFRRILKPDGNVFLVWNMLSEENPYAQALEELNARLCEKVRPRGKRVPKEHRAISLFGQNGYDKAAYDNVLDQSCEALLGGMLSASYAPRRGDTHYEAYVSGIREIFDRYGDGKTIRTVFVSECYYGKLPAHTGG